MSHRTVSGIRYRRLEMLTRVGHSTITIVGHAAGAMMVMVIGVWSGHEESSYNVMMRKVRLASVVVTDQVRLSSIDQVRVVVLMKLEGSRVGHEIGVWIRKARLESCALSKIRTEATRLMKIWQLTKRRVGTVLGIGVLPMVLHLGSVFGIRIAGSTTGNIRGLDAGRGLGRLLGRNLIRHRNLLALRV